MKIKFINTLFMLLLLTANLGVATSFVSANGQETCPHTGDWTKIDDLSGISYTYNAPEGKLIAEWCYKASTTVNYGTVSPPQNSVTVTSTVKNQNDKIQDLSHASFRLINKPINTVIPTNTPTFTSTTDMPISTPTETTVIETPEETPEVPTKTIKITNTPIPTLPPPNSKVTPEALLPVTGGEQLRLSIFSLVLMGFLGIVIMIYSLKRKLKGKTLV